MYICYSPQLLLAVYFKSIIINLLCVFKLLSSNIHLLYILIIVSYYLTFVAMLFYSVIYCIYSLRRSIASTVSVSLILSS